MRRGFVMIGLIMLIGWSTLGHGQDQPTAPAEPKLSPEQQAIRRNAEIFVRAFDKGDAKAIASLYAPRAQFVVDGETVAEGRAAIDKAYADFFKDNPKAKISVTIDSIKLLGPNLAIEKGTSQLSTSDEPVVDAYTLVHTRIQGRWLTASAEIRRQAVAPVVDWKAQLAHLVGSWRAEHEDWSVDTSFEWVANGNFLKRTFSVSRGKEQQASGVQIIGWDPIEGAITSWSFGSDGGHGRGWWTRDEDHWVIDVQEVTQDGETLRSTNLFTVLDKDHLRWQSTQRSLDGAELEDTPSIRIRRVKPSK